MRYILTLIGGLLIGAVLVYFLLVGAPRAGLLPGVPLKSPEQGGDPPGTAVVTLDERFFDPIFAAIFRDLSPPTIPLQFGGAAAVEPNGSAVFTNAAFQAACPNQVVLVQQGSGVTSAVRFADNNVVTLLAFNGSYDAPLYGCVQFKGWARATLQLSFDAPKQTLYGRINVEGVNLEGVQPQMNGIVTGLVQNAINQRVNPLEILKPQQLSFAVPIQASNGTLKTQAKDIRSEVVNNQLRLHISYEFTGQKAG
jgi:hypothetical protein